MLSINNALLYDDVNQNAKKLRQQPTASTCGWSSFLLARLWGLSRLEVLEPGCHLGQLNCRTFPAAILRLLDHPSQGLYVLYYTMIRMRLTGDRAAEGAGVVGLRVSRTDLFPPCSGTREATWPRSPACRHSAKLQSLAMGLGGGRSSMQRAYITPTVFSACSNRNPAAMSCHLGQTKQLFRKTHGES